VDWSLVCGLPRCSLPLAGCQGAMRRASGIEGEESAFNRRRICSAISADFVAREQPTTARGAPLADSQGRNYCPASAGSMEHHPTSRAKFFVFVAGFFQARFCDWWLGFGGRLYFLGGLVLSWTLIWVVEERRFNPRSRFLCRVSSLLRTLGRVRGAARAATCEQRKRGTEWEFPDRTFLSSRLR
jgi:hypothetical protein